MYTQSQIDSVLYQSYVAIGEIALEVTRLKNKGVRCDKLYHRGYCLRNYLHAYERGTSLTDKQKEALLKCMIEVSQIREYPASAPLLYREAPSVLTGLPGPKGDTGDTGPQGDAGAQGDPGPEGPQGIQGPVGPDGPAGPQGPEGPQGATGDQGPQGDPGDTGAQGDPGIQGPAGADGDIYASTSTTNLTIPSTHPTAGSMVLSPLGLAYTIGQQVIIANDANNYFTAVVTAYNAGSGLLNYSSVSHVGTGTFSSWNVNLNGAPGPQGKAFAVTDPDITLDAVLIATVEGGSWTPISPYVASVYYDARANKSTPAALNGNMDGHSIQYDGTNWYDNGIWRGPAGSSPILAKQIGFNNSSFTVPLNSYTTTAQVDMGAGSGRNFLIQMMITVYGNSVLEYNYDLQASTNGTTWVPIIGYRYKPDVIGSSGLAIPSMAMYRLLSSSYRYFRMRVGKDNNNSGTHRESVLTVEQY